MRLPCKFKSIYSKNNFQIHLHGNDLNSLHKHIPQDILPAEYGGTLPPFDNTQWRQRILNNQEYFVKLETYSNNNNNHLFNRNLMINRNCSDEQEEDDEDLEIEEDNKSLEVEVDGNSINYIDTETEDSEYDEDIILSPRHKAPPLESLEELFLKHDFNNFSLNEKEVADIK